jgi:hypothetical protein
MYFETSIATGQLAIVITVDRNQDYSKLGNITSHKVSGVVFRHIAASQRYINFDSPFYFVFVHKSYL